MYNTMYETSRQSRFDARYWMLGAGALDDGEGGGKRVQDGEHMYTCGRFMAKPIQYCKVKKLNRI